MFKFCVLLIVFFSIVIAKEKELKKFIKVEGIGQIKAQPDYAIINIGVYNVNQNVDSAQLIVSNVCKKLFALSNELGIDTLQINTDRYSINKKSKYNKDREEEFLGYEVLVLYNIKINKLSIVDTFLGKSVLIGSNEVKSVKFNVNNPDSLKAIAMESAMKEAIKNAETILLPTGKKLGGLLKCTDDYRGNFEISSDVSVTIEAPEFIKGGALSGGNLKTPVFIKIIPDVIEFSEKIHVIFEIK